MTRWNIPKRFAVPSRDTAARLLALLACGLLALSAYTFRPMPRSLVHYNPTRAPESYFRHEALLFLALGGAALGAALKLSRRLIPLPRPVPGRMEPGAAQSEVPLVIGILALGAVAESNGGLIGIHRLAGMSSGAQFGLLVGGMALIAWGLGGMARPRRWSRESGREALFVLVITLAALGLRLWRLGSSVRVPVDEIHFMLGVEHFWSSDYQAKLLVPMPTAASFPYLYAYGQTWMVNWLGRSLTGLRALSAILGALAIPALYLLARELYDRTTARLAAVLLATFPPHLHFSRLGLNNIADPLFGTLALAFLARGWRTNRRSQYAIAGVMLGMTQYFYEGGRLLFPLLVIAWWGCGRICWRPRPPLRGLLVLLLVFVIVAAPVYYTLAGIGYSVADRMGIAGLNQDYWNRHREQNNLHARLIRLRQSLLVYVNAPENTFLYAFLYYGGHHPLILEWLVPVFLLGCFFVAWRWRAPGILPLLWVLAVSLGNAQLIESAVSARYVVAFPALALLIAVGARGVLALILSRRSGVILGLLVGAAAVGQTVYYFGPHLRTFNVEVRESARYDVFDALFRSADFPPGTQIHVICTPQMSWGDAQVVVYFLADHLSFEIQRRITGDNLLALPRDVDQAFFVPPDDETTPELLRRQFTLIGPQYSPADLPPGKALVLYYVPAGTK